MNSRLFENRWTPAGGTAKAVRTLIAVNGLVFVLQWVVGPRMIEAFGLFPYAAWSRFHVWQLFTYLFLHGNFFHILINMYTLWVFGTEVEHLWGSRAFVRYYAVTGIGAGIVHTILTPHSMIPTIGASGAVLGVLTAYALLFPDRVITLFLFFILPIRMRARTLALIFADLGGMLVGYLYARPSGLLVWFKKLWNRWQRDRQIHVSWKDKEDLAGLRRRVDDILDKANRVGIQNLDPEEKRFLEKASRILKKKPS
jgi:membrane associated rhomboid family serine protease